MEKKLTVVFDDGCSSCTAGKNVAEALDRGKGVDFVGMNTERGKALIEKHGLDMNKSAYAFRADGSRSERSTMMQDVLSYSGILGFFLSLPFRIPYLSDKLYDLLALHRNHTTKSKAD